jgi:hypothetical protein
MRETEREK